MPDKTPWEYVEDFLYDLSDEDLKTVFEAIDTFVPKGTTGVVYDFCEVLSGAVGTMVRSNEESRKRHEEWEALTQEEKNRRLKDASDLGSGRYW